MMAWTTPRTWSAGETVTAALLNTHLRDNLAQIHTRFSMTSTPAAGAVMVGDGSDFAQQLTIATAAAGVLKHEVGGIELDISGIAKGSLITASGSGTAALLAAGTNGYFLKRNTSAATGLEWNTAGVLSNSAGGTYTGNGSGSNREINIGFTASMVVLQANGDESPGERFSGFSVQSDIGTMFGLSSVSGGHQSVTCGNFFCSTNGFTVGDGAATGGQGNESSVTYRYFALKI